MRRGIFSLASIDLISCLFPDKTLDNFDFTFNPKMNLSLIFDLAARLAHFTGRRAASRAHLLATRKWALADLSEQFADPGLVAL